MTLPTPPVLADRLSRDPHARPRLRGWLHVYAFGGALVCGLVLCGFAAVHASRLGLVGCMIYSATVCGLFGVSALYHRRVWEPRGYLWMRRLDHSMIFVFIAGTYTPFCLFLPSSPAVWIVLAVVWAGALGGVALQMLWPHAPRALNVPLYMLLGWVALPALPEILAGSGLTVVVLLAAGGAVYSAGALFYAFRWPDPWPRTFGYHEFFHAATLAAAACHHVAVYFALFA